MIIALTFLGVFTIVTVFCVGMLIWSWTSDPESSGPSYTEYPMTEQEERDQFMTRCLAHKDIAQLGHGGARLECLQEWAER